MRPTLQAGPPFSSMGRGRCGRCLAVHAAGPADCPSCGLADAFRSWTRAAI